MCLVTPGHLATNPRLVKEADALVSAGYNVEVVAARFVAWADEADNEFEGRPWVVHRTVFGPMAPRSVWLRQGALRRLCRLAWRLRLGRLRTAELAFHPVIPALERLASDVPAGLYIAHNLAALPAAGRVARSRQALLGFDAEDFHLGEIPPGSEHERARQLVHAIEGYWLPRCAHRTAASPGIARAVAETYGVALPLVVRNVFPRSQAPEAPRPPSVEPGPAVYWFSQTIGPHRGLEAAVQSLALSVSKPHLYLRGSLAPGYGAVLEDLAGRVGVADRVHVLPPLPPGALVRDVARFHAGLACEVLASPNQAVALSNKAFTYLLAGIPTLLSATPAQAELAAELGPAAVLFPPGDAAALAASLDELLLDGGQLLGRREAAWRLGQERFNWEHESRVFLAQVEAVLGRSEKQE